jgi:hypothetical protein
MVPTWISALAYGQAMAIKMFSGIINSNFNCHCPAEVRRGCEDV